MIKIGIVGHDGVTALDMIGPMEVFATANYLGEAPAYEMIVLSAGGRRFRAASGVVMSADFSLSDAPAFDTIIVPGGSGLREPRIGAPIAKWLRTRWERTRRMVSVCTGLYAYGEAGLLDGKTATTHWRFAADVAKRYPGAQLDPNSLFLRDGGFYSSGGVTAGIDLALALVEEDLGERAALATAREMIIYMKRPGGQMQFSEPLQFQTRAVDRLADLATWMLRNLKKELSVEVLAARAGLGTRHFSRRFKSTFGVTPADYVEHLRLDEGRRRLLGRHETVDRVAASVGYASADSFRRAFERRFGVQPSLYRRQFAAR